MQHPGNLSEKKMVSLKQVAQNVSVDVEAPIEENVLVDIESQNDQLSSRQETTSLEWREPQPNELMTRWSRHIGDTVKTSSYVNSRKLFRRRSSHS